MTDSERRWREFLNEDSDDAQTAESLLPVVRKLHTWQIPQPAPHETARLLAALLPPEPRRDTPELPLLHAWLVLCCQVQVVARSIWLASALTIALGALLTLFNSDVFGSLPISLLAPLAAGIGLALIYNDDDPLREMENATPTGVIWITLARMCLVFAFDLGIALAASLTLALLSPALSLSALVLSWLAPMLFLSGLAYFLSVFTGDAVLSAMLCLGLWGVLVLTRLLTASGLGSLPLPDLLAPTSLPFLPIIAAALLAGGLLLQRQKANR